MQQSSEKCQKIAKLLVASVFAIIGINTYIRGEVTKGKLRQLLLLLLVSFLSVTSFAQHRIAPNITNFKPEDYEAHNQNWAVVQDHRGVIYVANGDGVLEYDGLTWNQVPTSVLSSVLSLDVDENGKVYAGGIGDIGYLEPNAEGRMEFQTLTHLLPDSLRESLGNVWDTHVIGNQIFFRTASELIVVENDESVKVINAIEGFNKAFKAEEQIWLTDGDTSFSYYDSGKLKPVPNGDNFIGHGLVAAFPFEGNQFLVITSDTGLYLFNPHISKDRAIQPFGANYTSFLQDARIYCATPLSRGNIAIGTYKQGVLIFNRQGELIQKIARREGLISEEVINVFYDKHLQLWCAMNNGIARITDESPLSSLEEGQGYSGVINAMTVMNDELYFGTSQGVYQMREPNLLADTLERLITPVKGVAHNCFQLFEMGEEKLLGATTGGLYIIENMNASMIHENYTRVVSFVADDEVAVSSGRGVFYVHQYDGGTWRELFTIPDLPDEALSLKRDLSRTDSAVFWIGLFSHGIAKVAFSDDWSSYTVSHYGETKGVPERWTQVFYVNNEVRFGTDGSGLLKYNARDDRMTTDIANGLDIIADGSIFVLEQSPDGTIYLDESGEIWRLIPQVDGTYKIDSISFAPLDIGEVNMIVPQDGGARIWLGGIKGLANYHAKMGAGTTQEFKTLIRSVRIGLDSSLFNGNFYHEGVLSASQQEVQIPNLNYQYNGLTITFSAPIFNYQNKLEYSYKLEGFEDEWSDWGTSTTAQYVGLDEGSYSFNVKARDVFGAESTVATYQFVVLPPWYRTWWAYTLFACLGALTIFIFIKLREAAKVKEKNEYLEAEVEARTAEIVQQRDSIAEQKTIIEHKNKGIVDSIRYAKRIQKAILPPDEMVNDLLNESFIMYQPKDIVSGDFYWLGQRESKVLFAAVDCTGHGVPGAFMSIVGYNQLKLALVEKGFTKPSDVLDFLNAGVNETLRQTREESLVKDGMDIGLCTLDKETLKLEFSGANNPVYIVRPYKGEGEENVLESELNDPNQNPDRLTRTLTEGNTELLEIKGNKQPIGAYIHETLKPFDNHSIQLEKGQMIYLFSDGYADQFGGEQNRKFMYKRFKRLLIEIYNKPMTDQKAILEETFANWKQHSPQIDDVCVFGVRV